MKLTLYSALGLSLILSSCSSLDPEYADYKKQKEAATQNPYSPGGDPYGVPGAAPTGGETGSYAPLQPLPGVYNPAPLPSPIDPIGSPTPAPNYPSIPSAPTPGFPSAVPSGPTTPHVVVTGDSLWGLSRRYNTSVEAIRAANGLSGDTIQTGRTLQIPQN